MGRRRTRPGRDWRHRHGGAQARMMHVNNLGQRAYVAAQRREMEKSVAAQLGEAIPVPGLSNAESQIAIPLLIRDDLIGVFSIEESRAALVWRARPGPRVDHQQPDCERDPQRAVVRAAQTRRGGLQEANASLEARVAERTAALERGARRAGAPQRSAHAGGWPLARRSPAVRGLRDAIARQARSIEPLLLTGPAGAGKEAVARCARRVGAFRRVHLRELRRGHHAVSAWWRSGRAARC